MPRWVMLGGSPARPAVLTYFCKFARRSSKFFFISSAKNVRPNARRMNPGKPATWSVVTRMAKMASAPSLELKRPAATFEAL